MEGECRYDPTKIEKIVENKISEQFGEVSRTEHIPRISTKNDSPLPHLLEYGARIAGLLGLAYILAPEGSRFFALGSAMLYLIGSEVKNLDRETHTESIEDHLLDIKDRLRAHQSLGQIGEDRS